MSFKSHKNVLAVKLLNNFSNTKLSDPHGFKEELKTKYDAILAVVGKSPNGTGPMAELLKAGTPALDWKDYCTMEVVDQTNWEERGDASTKVMILLLTQHPNKTIVHQRDKKGIRMERRVMIPNPQTRTTTLHALLVQKLEKLQHLKIPLLLVMDLASVFTSLRLPKTSFGQHDLQKNY